MLRAALIVGLCAGVGKNPSHLSCRSQAMPAMAAVLQLTMNESSRWQPRLRCLRMMVP
jgi:hypothetical protein